MDELAESLALSFSVTKAENTTAAEHPRFSQYKAKPSGSNQDARRKKMLEAQKSKRFDYQSHARRLGENCWNDWQEELENDPMDTTTSYVGRPGRYYRDQLMLSEWMVEVPEDFEEEWMLVPCPVGRRNLVVAARGETAAYSKNGYNTSKFASRLPGGNKSQIGKDQSSYTILDCIYNEVLRTYYILDMMCWRSHPIFDSETEFRFYWLNTQIAENPEIKEIAKSNPYRFEPLPNYTCTKENIQNVLSTPMNVELDGLLFYHKRTHYTFGSTPLVVWLKPYMVPEILGVSVPQKLMQAKPAKYTNFADHVVQVQEEKEKKAKKEEERAKRREERRKSTPRKQDGQVQTTQARSPNESSGYAFNEYTYGTAPGSYSFSTTSPPSGGGGKGRKGKSRRKKSEGDGSMEVSTQTDQEKSVLKSSRIAAALGTPTKKKKVPTATLR